MATRTPASPELVKRFQSLFGALLHAGKFRPEILCALGLLGSCLTFPTEELYECLMHILVYLGRSRNLGTTYSAHVPDAGKCNTKPTPCTKPPSLRRSLSDSMHF